MGRKGFTLIELMIVVAVIAVLAAIAVPGIMKSQRSSHERSALTSLKTLAVAEFDFQANDRDGNGIRDLWTGDVAGLYCMTPVTTAGNTDQPVKLIDGGYAASDSNPLADGDAGGEYRSIDHFFQPSPKAGYWVTAMDADEDGNDFRRDTAGSLDMGAVHHGTRFGFLTFPDNYRVTGQQAGIIGESCTVFRRMVTVELKPGTSNPPGPVIDPDYINWPTNSELKAFWGKLD
jgi:prepilin-type N-terminal cleavage/methylation domain-containing protein